MPRPVLRPLALALLGLGALAGCSSDGGSSTSDTTSGGDTSAPPADTSGAVGQTATKAITAAQGGSLELSTLELDIPAGALATDTTVTAEVVSTAGLPGAADLFGEAVDLGPDGTQFLAPVSVSLALAGAVPEGKKAEIAWLDTEAGTWRTLTGSRVDGNLVTGTTDHFTVFSIVLRADGSQSSGGCANVAFSACGGDPTGSWSFTGACADFNEAIPGFESCEEAQATAAVDFDGTVELAAGGTIDGSFAIDTTITLRFPKDCIQIPGLPAGTPFSCTDIDESYRDDGDDCVRETSDQGNETVQGTWTVQGNRLLIDEGQGAGNGSEFCVQGNTLQVKIDQSTTGQGVQIWTLSRQ